VSFASAKLAGAAIACRTLRREILEFSFDYPLWTDDAAGSRDSLHYYLFSDRLAWAAMRMDAAGVPQTWTRATGTNYWPGYIAWYGLVQLGQHLRGNGSHHLDNFLRQVDWLEKHAIRRDDGAVVWVMNFDNPENGVVMRAPWVSAHAQGLAISAIVRGWRVTKRPHLLELLKDSARIFDLDVSEGGIRTLSNGKVFYTELPGGSVPGILDGFMTSLLGLYDLSVETKEPHIANLFTAGMEGLKGLLHYWDYRNIWSWYGLHENLCTSAYHCLNRVLLSVLGRLTADQNLIDHAEGWNPANFSQLDRVRIYSIILLTKNNARLRHRTWLFKTLPDDARLSNAVPQARCVHQTDLAPGAATKAETEV